jgi:hypothetical protein
MGLRKVRASMALSLRAGSTSFRGSSYMWCGKLVSIRSCWVPNPSELGYLHSDSGMVVLLAFSFNV